MSTSGRINGFDALRTVAMWLGVVLHSLIVYKAEAEPNWPHDSVNYHFLDWLYEYIHVFRMPLFYLVAGFFTRMVISKSGSDYFIRQRARRILIPFVIGLIAIVPLSLLPFHFNSFYFVQHFDFETAVKKSLLQMFSWNGMAHLWFLYYLLFFYGAAIIYVYALQQKIAPLTAKLTKYYERITPVKLLLPASMLFLLLLYFQIFTPPVYTGIKPNLIYLLYYGLFFGFGWLMHCNIRSIESLGVNGWALFITGTGLSALHFFKPEMAAPLSYSVVSVETIALVFGITGLFVKYLHKENKVWRYFSDASYWVYLIHVLIVASLQVALLESPVPGVLRMPIVLIITFLLTILTYQYFVRYTIIGEYLHGKRTRLGENK